MSRAGTADFSGRLSAAGQEKRRPGQEKCLQAGRSKVKPAESGVKMRNLDEK